MAGRTRSAQVLGALVVSGMSVFALASVVGPASASSTPPPQALTGTQHRVCAAPLPGTAACHAILLTPDTSSGNVTPARRPVRSTTTTSSTSSTTSTTAASTTTTTAAPTTTTTAAPTTTTTAAPTTTTTAAPTTTTTAAPTTTTAAPSACAFTATSPLPTGYAPCDLQSAYGLLTASAAASSTPPTVAIVDAYDDATAAADLATYRSEFGLPPCGTGCFTKINQTGGTTTYPTNNTNWAEEISLDVDMVSATCPRCNILLVEANSNSFTDLLTAENEAASFHPAAISNSWGGSEFSGETTYDGAFNHPGTAITVSTGDGGYGVEYPAASPYVTAVGGTHLVRSTNARGWSETVWSGAGSGCSAYEPQPSWQTSLGLTGCTHRMTGDVAAVADPNTGVAVYDTDGTSGWLVFGGTSVASPVIASVYALAGNASGVSQGSYPYGHTGSLNDVTSGSNSSRGCSPAYLCTGEVGYDGPTGVGTPAGTGGF